MTRRRLTLPVSVDAFENISGLGVRATVDGKKVLVGTSRLMKENNIILGELESTIDTYLRRGDTLMILAVDGSIQAVIGARDPIKPHAIEAIERLRASGIEIAMITGDNRMTADIVARQLGIERVFAEVLPEDKANYVKQLQREGKFTAMV